jgi:hypothetical protein
MDQTQKDPKGSTNQIQTFLKSLRWRKIQSKLSKKPEDLIHDAPGDTDGHNIFPVETVSTESTGIIWNESLLRLPNELLEHVLFQLHPLETVKCRQVGLDRL